MNKSLERRALLRGAGVAGASVVGVVAAPEVASAQEGHGGHASGLLGAWRITHTDDPPSNESGDAIVAFSAGGVLTVEELGDGTSGLGAWRSEGHRFRARFYEASPGEGSDPGVVVEIRVRGRLHHDHLAGTYAATVRSAADERVLAAFTGEFTGTRVRP
jgi:hypothetical protein